MIRPLIVRIGSYHKRSLLLMGISLGIAAITLSVILGVIGSVRTYLNEQSIALIGGDIAIETQSGTPPQNTPALEELRNSGATFSLRTDTLAMVVSQRPKERWGKLENLLSTIKVVDDQYPLYGSLTLTHGGSISLTPSEAFVHPDLLERMGIVIGDEISIGQQRFLIKDTILSEPDRIAGSFRLGPLVVISRAGWEKTGINGAQSRASDTLLIKFNSITDTQTQVRLAEALAGELRGSGARVQTGSEGPRSLFRILDTAANFFFTVITLSLFLAVVNIRINLSFMLKRFERTIALFFVLGMSSKRIMALFAGILTSVAIVAGAIGSFAGNLFIRTALPSIDGTIGVALAAPALSANVLLVTLFVTFLTLIGSIGFFLTLNAIQPKSLLVGYGSEEYKKSSRRRELATTGSTFLGLVLGVWVLTRSLTLAGISGGIMTGLFLGLYLLVALAISSLYASRSRLPFIPKSIIAFLRHQGSSGITAIASLAIAIAAVSTVLMLEKNITENLGRQVARDAPNIYAIDVQTDQLAEVRKTFGPTWEDFPVLRGRLLERNDTNIQSNIENEDPELRREFNLTYRDHLITGEKLAQGIWHGTNVKNAISIEKEFGERTNILLGDSVTFLIQGFRVTGTVTSVREVEESNALPFFYFVMSNDLLSQFPQTYFGYAYIDELNLVTVQNQLAARYPNVTVIPTIDILNTVREVVAALSLGVNITSLPALLLGILLVTSMLLLSINERANDVLIFSVFGIHRAQLVGMFALESFVQVTLSAIVGIGVAIGTTYGLNRFVFKFETLYWSFNMVSIFLVIAAVAIVSSIWVASRLTKLPPSSLLRKQ